MKRYRVRPRARPLIDSKRKKQSVCTSTLKKLALYPVSSCIVVELPLEGIQVPHMHGHIPGQESHLGLMWPWPQPADCRGLQQASKACGPNCALQERAGLANGVPPAKKLKAGPQPKAHGHI